MATYEEIRSAWLARESLKKQYWVDCKSLGQVLVDALKTVTGAPALHLVPWPPVTGAAPPVSMLAFALKLTERAWYGFIVEFRFAADDGKPGSVRVPVEVRAFGPSAEIDVAGVESCKVCWPLDASARTKIEELATRVSETLKKDLVESVSRVVRGDFATGKKAIGFVHPGELQLDVEGGG